MSIYFITLCILANAIGKRMSVHIIFEKPIYMELSAYGNNDNSIKIDCRNKELDANGCDCFTQKYAKFIVLICKSNLNELPSLPGNGLKVVNAFDRWPIISLDAKALGALDFSENQIDSIGDLSNLDNIGFLNISYNRVKSLNSSISALQKLSFLDLSYNLIEKFHFEDLVPNTDKNSFDSTQPIFGSLKYLFLNGNQIKQIFNFDLVFVAMPLCNFINLDKNLLTSLDVFVLSQQSQNVIEKVKQALVINDSYLDIFESQKEYGYYYGFKENLIKRFNVNFKVILNDVFKGQRKIFFKRILSISLINETTNILCDCNTYLAFDYLIKQLDQVYGNRKIPDGDLQSFECFQKDSNESLNLFDLIDENQVNGGEFCAGNSSEYKWNIYDSNVTSHSTSVIRQFRYFPQFFVEIVFLRLFL